MSFVFLLWWLLYIKITELSVLFGSDRRIVWNDLDGAGRWMRKRTYQTREKRNVQLLCMSRFLFVWVFRSQSQMRSSSANADADASRREEEECLFSSALDWMDGRACHVLSSSLDGEVTEMIPDSEYCLHCSPETLTGSFHFP